MCTAGGSSGHSERFGVHGLQRTPELESALYWLFRSVSRLGELSKVVIAILERRLANRDALAGVVDAASRDRLDRLASATHGRQQAIADLARDVRFHYFDEPPMEAAAAELYAEMSGHMAHLIAEPDSSERAERVGRLVWCPLPIRSLLLDSWGTGHFAAQHTPARQLVMEVYIRRFYRICDIGDIDFHEADGYQYATTNYRTAEHNIHLVVGYLPWASIPEWSSAIAAHLADAEPSRVVVVDLVTWRDGEQPEIAETAAELGSMLTSCGFGRHLHRLDVAVTSEIGAREERFRTQNVTFARDRSGAFVEDPLYRNLHPMLAERLEIWRLSNFRLERRPSPEDVYLFDGVALDNTNDHRLFALAEVRELAAVPDPTTGHLISPRSNASV